MKNKILNLGILAHVDAGKTTLTESLLYHSNIICNMGNVDKGTTITDSLELEKKRGMTIKASTVSFSIEGVKINLIDTPGHADFIGEVERSLRVLDGVILVVSAVEGVQPQTRILFHHLQKMKMPVLIFVNKIDRIGADYERTCKQISEQLSPCTVRMQKVEERDNKCQVTNRLFSEDLFAQQIIELSDKLLEKYLDEKPISQEELIGTMRFRVQKGKLYPIYAGTALRDFGVIELMHGIVTWLPLRKQIAEMPKELSAYVYKVEYDEKGRKKAYFRIFAGRIAIKDKITIAESEREFVVNNLSTVIEGRQSKCHILEENDIGILMDIPEIKCGDFLGREWKQKGLTAWGEPMLRVVIRPFVAGERSKLLEALKLLEYEDPLLSVEIHQETQEIQVSLFGKLQIEILDALLRERFHIRVVFSGIKTIYKVKPKHSVYAQIRLNEPGNYHRAGIGFQVEPLPTGAGNQYETKVSYGFIEASFQNAVRAGVEKAFLDGLGDGIVDTKVIFKDADYDSVTSTPADFRRLAPLVIREALQTAGVSILEPIMKYRLCAPICYEKRIIAELRKIEASLENVIFSDTEMRANGDVPFDTAKEFQIQLSTITGGQGIFEMEFYRYQNKNRIDFLQD